MILKKLGKRYAMGKIPGGKIMFVDRRTKKLVTIKQNGTKLKRNTRKM